ncbi:hypothetical protein RRG08_006162 [Elysia crispata]|uniref:Uncharacterized protein n=1 Tax=Elysia crispata TaxID=231223 RepID=A0AAE1AXF8_9GAST|nr:hypothetical protein RRG08_006162 [Elysia crispata]
MNTPLRELILTRRGTWEKISCKPAHYEHPSKRTYFDEESDMGEDFIELILTRRATWEKISCKPAHYEHPSKRTYFDEESDMGEDFIELILTRRATWEKISCKPAHYEHPSKRTYFDEESDMGEDFIQCAPRNRDHYPVVCKHGYPDMNLRVNIENQRKVSEHLPDNMQEGSVCPLSPVLRFLHPLDSFVRVLKRRLSIMNSEDLFAKYTDSKSIKRC